MSLNLSSRDRAYIIGEAGTNHAAPRVRERAPLALDLILAARRCGADAIKFQIFYPPIRDDMFCWIDGDERRVARWEDSALDLPVWEALKCQADEHRIDFLASVFQHRTVAWLKELGVK